MQKLLESGAKAYYDLEFSKSLSCFLQALALDLNNNIIYYNLGLVYGAMQDYELALAHYKKAVALNPKDIRSINNIAWIFVQNIKDIDTACKYLDYAIEIAPNDAEAYNVYGNIHFDKKEYKEAVLYYKKALKYDKDYAKNYYDIAKAYIGLEDFKNAYESLKICIELNPNYPLADELLKNIEKFI